MLFWGWDNLTDVDFMIGKYRALNTFPSFSVGYCLASGLL